MTKKIKVGEGDYALRQKPGREAYSYQAPAHHYHGFSTEDAARQHAHKLVKHEHENGPDKKVNWEESKAKDPKYGDVHYGHAFIRPDDHDPERFMVYKKEHQQSHWGSGKGNKAGDTK